VERFSSRILKAIKNWLNNKPPLSDFIPSLGDKLPPGKEKAWIFTIFKIRF